MKNGQPWIDTDGNIIHAHGGWILKVGGWFYWYGENRTENNFVSCYRTKDFKEFEFRNNVLTTDSRTEKGHVESCRLELKLPMKFFENASSLGFHRIKDGFVYANIERPKVIYCEKTKKYVMWMHYENGYNYDDAACAVATCDTPDGDFIYHGSFCPFGQMSRDCTVFESDEKMYFVSAAQENHDLYVYRLTGDYMNVEENVSILLKGLSREAPSIFKKDDKLFLLSSGCTGWLPNQGQYAYCLEGKIEGEWSELANFGDETTFESQPSFVLPVKNGDTTEYYYFGDRWGRSSNEYLKSTYVVLKIQFDNQGNPFIEYSEDAQLPII